MTNTTLVQGYVIRRASTANTRGWQERLYAVYPDASIRATGWMDPTAFFDARGRVWATADALPEGAEWIGGYPAPTGR